PADGFRQLVHGTIQGATSATAASPARSRNRRELDQSAPRPLQPASLLRTHGRVRTAGLCGRARTIEPPRRFQIRRRWPDNAAEPAGETATGIYRTGRDPAARVHRGV